MPNIYLKKELYEKIVRKNKNVTEYVDTAVEDALQRESIIEGVKKWNIEKSPLSLKMMDQ